MRPDQSLNQLLIDFVMTGSELRRDDGAFRWIPGYSDLCDGRMSFHVLRCVGLLNRRSEFARQPRAAAPYNRPQTKDGMRCRSSHGAFRPLLDIWALKSSTLERNS